MGPPSADRGFISFSTGETRLPLPSPNRDEFVIEAIEIAGISGEAEVVPFRRRRADAPTPGTAMVEVVFFDRATLGSFLRAQAVKRSQVLDAWVLVRRWARTNDDADLDEAICGGVAGALNAAFPGLLRASIITVLN